jgi:hypothetical protein
MMFRNARNIYVGICHEIQKKKALLSREIYINSRFHYITYHATEFGILKCYQKFTYNLCMKYLLQD